MRYLTSFKLFELFDVLTKEVPDKDNLIGHIIDDNIWGEVIYTKYIEGHFI